MACCGFNPSLCESCLGYDSNIDIEGNQINSYRLCGGGCCIVKIEQPVKKAIDSVVKTIQESKKSLNVKIPTKARGSDNNRPLKEDTIDEISAIIQKLFPKQSAAIGLEPNDVLEVVMLFAGKAVDPSGKYQRLGKNYKEYFAKNLFTFFSLFKEKGVTLTKSGKKSITFALPESKQMKDRDVEETINMRNSSRRDLIFINAPKIGEVSSISEIESPKVILELIKVAQFLTHRKKDENPLADQWKFYEDVQAVTRSRRASHTGLSPRTPIQNQPTRLESIPLKGDN